MGSGGRLQWAAVSVAVVLLAVWYRQPADRLDAVLESLLRAERLTAAPEITADRPAPRVAVGYGGCMDLFARALSVLDDGQCQVRPAHHGFLKDRRQLQQTFLYFFQHGAAAERYISDGSLFAELVALARKAPDARYEVGGNAPVMAARFAREGCSVLLGSGRYAGQHVPERVEVVGPQTPQPDIHLILEYAANTHWCRQATTRANRFIIHSDVANPTLSALEDFGEALKKFDPDMLVVSGLQMMDNFPFKEGARPQRLELLRQQLVSQQSRTKIHFEMASFTDTQLLTEMLELVTPYVDSMGMNEQELPNLQSMLLYGNVSLVSDANPRVAGVLDQMRDVMRALGDVEPDAGSGRRPLTRLHVHTLAFQAIMTRRDSIWKNSMSAAARASLTAHRHICGTKQVDTRKARLIMDDSFSVSSEPGSRRVPFDPSRPVSCWTEGQYEMCVAPVLVCTEVYQTAGGGDNISSAGLVPQILG
ncbi:ADP-dependent glucokinase-like [Amphibalanus amphitrite]|uniref:ADP-dependent glucokinase-like n=1 Tax=Amphibalanus amphitrite TaxID=1232801 RepID=UPI001C90B5A1|nr:ADP-dependent glucokinase-like [Amphibalanus amphitrite]